MSEPQILEHHKAAADMWSSGGRAYDQVSFAISDALAHAAQRLNPRPGDAILDVATGTGWSARNVARLGARVTGVDIASDLIDAAWQLSAGFGDQIDFQVADAESLPFADHQFDGVISTFGVMFALNQNAAAAELARVCKPGGKVAITGWVPGGAVASFFGVLAGYSEAPPPPASPLAWGDPDHVTSLLGDQFELQFERGTNNAYHQDCRAIWDWYESGFGPLRQLAETLPPERLKDLRRDCDAYHRHYQKDAGLHIEREYLLTVGVRR